jgi:hypothetical protein
MIEIVPSSDSLLGGYNVSSAVDTTAYLYIYNDVFVEEWNQYIKKIKAGSDFIKSKRFMEAHESDNDVSLETLSHSEKVELARQGFKQALLRSDKKGRYFQKLVDEFDEGRNLIAFYNSKFYTYVTGNFADYISVYLIEEIEITNILNDLYLRISKRNRIITKEELLRNFEINDED